MSNETMKTTLSRAEHWEMDQEGQIKHSSSGVDYYFDDDDDAEDNADNDDDDVDDIQAMMKFCCRPLPR